MSVPCCVHCGGHGTCVVGHGEEWRLERCLDCNGTGKTPVVVRLDSPEEP